MSTFETRHIFTYGLITVGSMLIWESDGPLFVLGLVLAVIGAGIELRQITKSPYLTGMGNALASAEQNRTLREFATEMGFELSEPTAGDFTLNGEQEGFDIEMRLKFRDRDADPPKIDVTLVCDRAAARALAGMTKLPMVVRNARSTQGLKSGDHAFDAMFTIETTEPEETLKRLSPRVRQGLKNAHKLKAQVRLDSDRLELGWEEAPFESGKLRALVTTMVQIVRGLELAHSEASAQALVTQVNAYQ